VRDLRLFFRLDPFRAQPCSLPHSSSAGRSPMMCRNGFWRTMPRMVEPVVGVEVAVDRYSARLGVRDPPP